MQVNKTNLKVPLGFPQTNTQSRDQKPVVIILLEEAPTDDTQNRGNAS